MRGEVSHSLWHRGESNLTADNVDHIMSEIGCSVRRACINHGIVPDPLLDLDSNLAHDEQSEASTSSDLEKSNVTGVVA